MLGQRIQKRIEDLRREPEHVRLQVAIRYTIILGAVIGIVWVAVFLPLQIRRAFRDDTAATPTPVLTPDTH
ncbi:MAG: hypothetical protein AAB538_06060 [Patescibacteria group bacterium]